MNLELCFVWCLESMRDEHCHSIMTLCLLIHRLHSPDEVGDTFLSFHYCSREQQCRGAVK